MATYFVISVIAPDATFGMTSNLSAVNEGLNVIVTLNTTGVQIYQQLPFTITGTGIVPEDFVGLSSLNGAFTIINGQGVVTLTLSPDYDYETKETFTITLNDRPQHSVTIDVNNIMPGVWWDADNSEEAAVWDLGRAPWGASYWNV